MKLAQSGDKIAAEYLIREYAFLAEIMASKYFLKKQSREDLIQEGLIGLYTAVRDFKPDNNSTFKSFAALCIKRSILSAVKTSRRGCRAINNDAFSLDASINEKTTYLTLFADPAKTPEDAIIEKETFDELIASLKNNLASFERQVFHLRFEKEYSYKEVSEQLGASKKKVDNAIQRIRRKAALVKQSGKKQARLKKAN